MKLIPPINANTSMVDRTHKIVPKQDVEEDSTFRLSAYIHSSCGYIAKNNHEENPSDHCYVRNTNWRPDFVFAKPLRTLFVYPSNENNYRNEDETVDVVSVQPALPPVYDQAKASALMEECERHVNFQHPDDGNPDWEEHIPRVSWTNMQTRLFNKVVRVLHSDRLARLAHKGSPNEPVLRRITVDKTARRLRQIFASVVWNIKYTQWVHNILMDNLHASYLVSYLDALQTLKSKVPTLVDRILAGTSTRAALTTPNHELLNIVQKRPWDPLYVGITNYKPKKLPQDPILVMVPSGPGSGNLSNSRTHHWMANLSALGTVVCVYSSPGRVVGKVSVSNCLDHMLASTRAKVAELHADYGDKPIILVGIGSGATLACQVALVENVTAVVCLGFPLYTVEDNRGTPDDSLLNLSVPVLFVIGQNASTASVDDMEEMREKLNVVSSLVLVGGADDQLRLTKAKKKLDGITQTVVDKCVMDEVADFLGTLLSPGYVPPVRPVVPHTVDPPPKRAVSKPVERKRKCDVISSNPDSIGATPAKKGRKPKISMMQKMVQNKWANQVNITTGESPRPSTTVTVTPSKQIILPKGVASASSGKHVVLDQKNMQLTIQSSNSSVAQPPMPTESTITVVAASNPTLAAATAANTRLPSGQLTSLSSILQPGTRGVISPSSCGSADSAVINVRSLSAPLTSNTPNMSEELNILDMPVILGDQNPEDPILAPQTQPVLLPKQVSPVKFILTNTKSQGKQGLSAIKYIGQSKQPVKIFISKPDRKPLFVGEVNEGGTSKAKPRIRHIPATKHSQFY